MCLVCSWISYIQSAAKILLFYSGKTLKLIFIRWNLRYRQYIRQIFALKNNYIVFTSPFQHLWFRRTFFPSNYVKQQVKAKILEIEYVSEGNHLKHVLNIQKTLFQVLYKAWVCEAVSRKLHHMYKLSSEDRR